MKQHHIRKGLLLLFGALFVAFGLGAFFGVPGGHDASHHTIGHNFTHVIAGLALLWVALVGNSGTRRWFCFVFGAVYLAIGLFGVFSVKDNLRLLPGVFEFHLEDDWVQMGTGLLFIVLGLLKKVPEQARDRPRRPAWTSNGSGTRTFDLRVVLGSLPRFTGSRLQLRRDEIETLWPLVNAKAQRRKGAKTKET
jgi:hypothetical protein